MAYRAGLMLAGVVGAFLRLHQITREIVADDEWHAIHAAAYRSYGYIASHVGFADYSIPLTLLAKLALDTIGLSEMVLRAPMLLCGVAAIVLLPWLVRDLVGREAAVLLAALLAVSPLHVYLSRYARPYAIVTLLAFVAAVAFYRWWSGGPRGWLHVYAAGGALACWFHLSALPAVLAPLGFAAAGLLLKAQPRQTWPRLLRASAEAGVAMAAALAVPLWTDLDSLRAKAGADSRADGQTLLGVVQLLAGSPRGWVVLAMAGSFACGIVTLARSRRPLATYGLALVLAQSAAILILDPLAGNVPIVPARYLMPVLPWLLLFAAVGMAAGLRAVDPHHRMLLPAAAALAVLLWLAGPLPAIHGHPNNWTNHARFQYAYDPENRHTRAYLREPESISPFYRQLASLPAGSITVLEAPWYLDWGSNAYPSYQRVHRQWMMIGFVAPVDAPSVPSHELRPPQARGFRNFVHVGAHSEIAARGIAYVILHRRLRSELPNKGPRSQARVARWIEEYTRRYGEPAYEDDTIVVFKPSPTRVRTELDTNPLARRSGDRR